MKLKAKVSAIVMAVTMIGCQQEQTFRIGVSQCNNDDWRNKMNEEIMRELMFHDDATVEIRSADNSSDKQISDLRYFADNGFDIVLVSPADVNLLTPVISEVYESGIPVVTFDANVEGDNFTAYQGADNKAIGRAAAELVEDLTDYTARVLELRGKPTSVSAAGRHAGFREVIGHDSGSEVLAEAYCDWNPAMATAATDSLLKVYPQVNVIYAHNDRMAIAASKVVRAAGRRDIKIVGVDGAPEIGVRAVADSVIDASLLYPTDGYRLVRTAMAILKGIPYQRETLLPSPSVVDLSNAEILLLQNEELGKEASKITVLKNHADEYWNRRSVYQALRVSLILVALLAFGLIVALARTLHCRRRDARVLASQAEELQSQRELVDLLHSRLAEAISTRYRAGTTKSEANVKPKSQVDIKPESATVESDFYDRFCQLVDAEMHDPELSVDSLAGKMGLGRTQFYRKIKAITGNSPVEILREMRLSRARTLLLTTDKPIAEIAVAVGFSSQAYFGRCYRERYNETPSEIRSV